MFGRGFNRPIEARVLPKGLESLRFGVLFDQPIKKGILPKGLKKLEFGWDYENKIEKGAIPVGLKTIKHEKSFGRFIFESHLDNEQKNFLGI